MSNYYKFFCKECDRGSEISLDALENKMPAYAPISLRNINEIVNKFKCSICQSKNFTLSGSNEVVIFDNKEESSNSEEIWLTTSWNSNSF